MKTHLLQRAYLPLILFFCCSCSSSTEDSSQPALSVNELAEPVSSNYTREEESAPNKLEYIDVSNKPIENDQKIIRKAELRFQVADYQVSTTAISNIIKQQQAILLSANEMRNEGSLENNLQIKVLPQFFEPLLANLAEQSIFLNEKTITSQDVTTEFIDVAARLKTKKAVEARYLQLLQQSRNVKDVLAVESQLKETREEIESSEARINYINRQTNYNTIKLTYYQKLPVISSPESGFGVRISNALQTGWDSVVGMFINLVQLWPILLVLPVFIYFIRKKFRRYQAVLGRNC